MGDFATQSDVASSKANGFGGSIDFMKITTITTVAGFFYSSWLMAGGTPAGGTPSTQAVCDKTTTGALGRFNNNSTGANRVIDYAYSIYTTGSGTPILFDRLVHMGGLDGNSTSVQTSTIDLTTVSGNGRCASDGTDVEWFLEVFSAGGAISAVSATITYTNEAGTGSRTATIPLAASGLPVSRLYPINPYLQSGDKWIKSIQSVQLNTGTAVSGNFGIVAGKRLMMLPWMGAENPSSLDQPCQMTKGSFWMSGLPKVPNDACLWFVFLSSSTSWGFFGHFDIRGVA